MFRFSRQPKSSQSPKRRPRYWLLAGAGVVLLLAVLAWQLNATLWMNHSNRVGNALVKKERNLQKHATSKGTCPPDTSTSVAGLLEAPKISLTAPVQQGTSDAVLNVAVGHNESSVWPGADGTAVFNAHDVSYFLNIDHLKIGDKLIYETACTQYVFEVQSHAVVTAGAPVFNTPGPSVTLVTCWPTNALWFTPDRYVVTAVEVAKRPLDSPTPVLTSDANEVSPPLVNAPPALINQGLSLTTNYAPMGSMTLAGSPSKAFTQSPGPLNVEFSALEAYFGATKALAQHQLGWWSDLAPTVDPVAPLLGATIEGYASPLDVTVFAKGSLPTGVAFSTNARVSGGSSLGQYNIDVNFAISHGRLSISSWKMTAV